MATIETQCFSVYYVFSSKGIQDFILRGDKLRWMIGGSELIERLPAFMEEVLSSLKMSKGEDYKVLSRAAGSARMLFRSKENALELARVMPLAISLYAPGLDFVQAVLQIKENLGKTMEKAEAILQHRRNRLFTEYPVAGPLVERCPRSGSPSTGVFSIDGDQELADSSMKAKERALREAKRGLSEKILPANSEISGLRLPSSFEELQHDGKGYIGVVHIDGNGLGSVIMDFFEKTKGIPDEKVADAYTELSQAIDNATINAVRTALAPIVERTKNSGKGDLLPFRPLVCAGDDVTIVLRAEDAFSFATAFLQEFENSTEVELKKVQVETGKLFLTACAGIAYVKDNYPFLEAYELCESLCSDAKEKTERECSAIAFWRLTTTSASDFQAIRQRELTHETSTETTMLTMMPYVTGKNVNLTSFPTVESLRSLLDIIGQMPRGSVRGVLSDLYEGRKKATRSLERIFDVAKQKGAGNLCDEFSKCLRAASRNTGPLKESVEDVLFSKSGDVYQTPLLDAVELRSVEC